MKKTTLAFLLIAALGTILRFWSLSADPSVLLDSGQVGDEGYWLYNARSLALFGKTVPDQFYHDFAAAPLFSLMSLLSFLSFGVGFWQARIVSAASGVVILFLTYLIAKKINGKVAMLSTFFVAINAMLILHNRLAVGESLSIMFATAGFSFLFLKKNAEVLSGAAFALSLLSKTTSFLYLPSAALMILSDSRNILDVKRLVYFCLSLVVLFSSIFGILYLRWGNEIGLIYSSFGSWYAPRTILGVWGNVFNFFLHPFWGSPFFFSAVILAILNSLNFLFEKKSRTRERRLLILWVLGFLLLGPFISGLSNARLLGLIVPISILGAQTVFTPSYMRLEFTKAAEVLAKLKGLASVAAVIVLGAIPSVITGKILLAIFKRASGNQTIVDTLPYVSLVTLVIFTFLALSRRDILKLFLRLGVYALVFLPIAAFIPLFWGYLNFFGVGSPPRTTVISSLTMISFVAFSLLASRLSVLKKAALPLVTIYVLFNLAGIATIIYKPTYNIEGASQRLGELVGKDSFLGFYGHELSVNNRAWPIYWAPRLNSVGGVNANWQDYNPKYILVTTVFDSKIGTRGDWPLATDIDRPLSYIETLDMSRQFLGGRREFKVDVFRIEN
ncbi:MAG: glycosyltransferase family 39 protein [Candidatus Curtissbacteria bacterium]